MDWQGELEKEDVIMLTKLIRNKQGDTLYHEIAAGGSVQVSAATILKLQDQCNSSQVIEELRKVLPLGCLSTKKNVSEKASAFNISDKIRLAYSFLIVTTENVHRFNLPKFLL